MLQSGILDMDYAVYIFIGYTVSLVVYTLRRNFYKVNTMNSLGRYISFL